MHFGVLIGIIGSHLSLLPERREVSPFSRGEIFQPSVSDKDGVLSSVTAFQLKLGGRLEIRSKAEGEGSSGLLPRFCWTMWRYQSAGSFGAVWNAGPKWGSSW